MDIRYAYGKDIPVGELESLFRSVGWRSGQWPERLSAALRGSGRVISAWEGNRLVGLIRGLDDGVWQACIDCLLVRRDYQGRGIASALLERLKEEYAQFLYVNVMPDEKENVGFYQKHGFRTLETGTAMQWSGADWEGEA